jgi:hypothetical protein
VLSAVGGTCYRPLYSDRDDQGGFIGVVTLLPRPAAEEMDADPVVSPGTMSFADDLTLTGGAPAHGNRYYRIQVVR